MDNDNKSEAKQLDDVNNERVKTSKMRVAHAIKLLNNPVACLAEGRKLDNTEIDIAHAVNLLDAANQEMQWACKHFEWNDEVCLNIDDACGKLGTCLANLVDEDNGDYDLQLIGCNGNDALAILGKVLATLIRWFDDTVDVSEV